ncbi:MAG: 5 ATPase [Chthoniobacteraceae bacterium]|nr:5 ATPase [Chthoniobacteraceae bacterium]
MTAASPLLEFAAAFDRAAVERMVRETARQRSMLAELFPRETLATLPLERYVVGRGDKDTLCYAYEFGSSAVGSIRGGSASKHLIYFSREQNALVSGLKGEPDPEALWKKLRTGLVESLDLAVEGRWEGMDAVPFARSVPALRAKMLNVAFPTEVLPIFSFTHLLHFLRELGVDWKQSKDEYTLTANRRLLMELRGFPGLAGWSTDELGLLLYAWRLPAKEGSLGVFAGRFNRDLLAAEISRAQSERAAFIAEFPLADFAHMPMERFAAPSEALEGIVDWLESKTPTLGEAGAPRRSKTGIDYLRHTGLFQKTLTAPADAQPLWEPLRNALHEGLQAAAAGQWEEIEKLSAKNGIPSAKRAKLLHIYFPEEFLPVSNAAEITHYLRALKLEDHVGEGGWNPTRNRRILEHLRSIPEIGGWSTIELARLLQAWAPMTERAFKIAPGPNAKYWQECLRDGVIVVGWGGVGDLRDVDSRDELKQFLIANDYNKSKGKASEKAGELWCFRNIRVGDWIVANEGTSKILAVGRVVQPGYEYLEEPYGADFNHVLCVEWDTSRARDIPTQKRWAFVTVDELSAEQRRLIIDGGALSIVFPPPLPLTMSAHALNRILYGPPGTGKTYSVIRRAASIVAGQAFEDTEAKRRYDEWSAQGRIRLATFHQSFGYEDFIEGIRPEMDNESGMARFTVRDGVFKEIAIDALFACLERVPQDDGAIRFEPLWNTLISLISETGDLEIPGLKNTTWILSETSQGNLQAINKKTRKEMQCGRNALTKVWGQLHPQQKIASPEVSQALGRGAHFGVIAAVYNFMHALSSLPATVPQAVLPPAEHTSQGANKPVIVQSYLELGEASGWRLRTDGIFPPYVLVIDEINRGNISRIFGELITLVEDDKRHTAENALAVILPVSRERFTVPPNLSLLGTMNTADKSLALLDVALRRRFDFEELAPDFSKCASLPELMKTVLTRLNERLELRKDRDHRIGHAFFTKVSDQAGFNEVFRRKVVPLLQEFFFNDIDGVRYVLGEHDRTDLIGFLRPLPAFDSRWHRNRWRWFTDEDPMMDCWSRLQVTLSQA